MQAVEKPGGERPPRYFFRTWDFTGPNRTPEVRAKGGRCVSCHMSGPRAIVPRQNPAFPTELGGVQSLDELNKLIVRDGPLDYSPHYDLQHFPTHLQVGRAGLCVECHNGRERNSLAFGVDERGVFDMLSIHQKVVTEQTMPVFNDAHISEAERPAAAAAVEREYLERLGEWLTETRCASPAPAHGETASPNVAR